MERRRRRLIFVSIMIVAVIFLLSRLDFRDISPRLRTLFEFDHSLFVQEFDMDLMNKLIGVAPNNSAPCWQAVHNRTALIYSGFIENYENTQTRIRFVGLSNGKLSSMHCWIYWGGGVVHAKARLHNLIPRFSTLKTSIFDCYFPGNKHVTSAIIGPETVAVGTTVNLFPKAAVWDLKNIRTSFEFAVCVMQPVFNWDNWLRLAAFIEYYLSLGAEHFVLYEESWTPEVWKIVKVYQKLNLITVLKHSRYLPALHDDSQTDAMRNSNYLSQLVTMHDCVYRMSRKAKYLALIDLDEYLVLRNSRYSKKTIPQFLQERGRDGPEVGAFHFQSVYAIHVWPATPSNQSVREVLEGASSTLNFDSLQRDAWIWPHQQRSKVIVKPATIDALEEHYVARFETRRFKQVAVSEQAALLYHDKPSTDALKYVATTQSPTLINDPTLAAAGAKILRKLKERLSNHID